MQSKNQHKLEATNEGLNPEAVPDLLEACKSLLHELRGRVSTTVGESMYSISIANAAIAKAERRETEMSDDDSGVPVEDPGQPQPLSEVESLKDRIEQLETLRSMLSGHTLHMLRHLELDHAAIRLEQRSTPLEQAVSQVLTHAVAVADELEVKVKELRAAIHCMGERVLPVGSYAEDVTICARVSGRVAELEEGLRLGIEHTKSGFYPVAIDCMEAARRGELGGVDKIPEPTALSEADQDAVLAAWKRGRKQETVPRPVCGTAPCPLSGPVRRDDERVSPDRQEIPLSEVLLGEALSRIAHAHDEHANLVPPVLAKTNPEAWQTASRALGWARDVAKVALCREERRRNA